jgi:HlyD family secretion protein
MTVADASVSWPPRAMPGSLASAVSCRGLTKEFPAVGSPVAGIVTQVMVRVGQKVKAGDGLFCLDDREVLADLKCQEANLHAAQAQLARLENQPRRAELPRAEADMREAAAAFELARDKLQRERRLSAAHAVPAESLVQRERELEGD